MQTVQRLLLLLFAAFAALTVLQQIRYGMICGRSEQEDKQDDPKAKACRQQSTIYAIAAAVSLIINIIIGALMLSKSKSCPFGQLFCFEKYQVNAKIRCFTADSGFYIDECRYYRAAASPLSSGRRLFFSVKKCFDTRFRALPLLSVQTAKGFVRYLHRASVRCQTGE